MINVLLRFIIIYFLMTAAMKLLGKRQIGQMQQSEFVTTLFLSELACFVVTDVDIPLLFGILPVLLMLTLEVLISYGSIRSPLLKRSFDEASSFLMREGRIVRSELKNNRITIEELLSMLRLAGVSDITQVRDAILEPNGQLSVVRTTDGILPLAVVVDGEINDKALGILGRDREWLNSLLGKQNAEDRFLVLADQNGIRFSVGKDGEK